MSKKSRRRNRNLLKMASLAGLGLALSNIGKGTEMANIMPEGGGRDAATMKMPKVFQDDIMRGGSGVKFMPNRNPKSIRVEGETINPFGFMFKKGGRVKKGFAKKKKQANKMRKK